MKTLRVINASSDKQVSYRSINEIKKELELLQSHIAIPHNVDNIHNSILNLNAKILSRNEIMDNLNLIYYYDEIAKKIVSIKAQLTYGFKDHSDYDSVIDLVKSMNKDLETKLKSVLSSTHKLCWKSLDRQTKRELKLVYDILKKKYPSKVFLLLDGVFIKNKWELVYRFYIRLTDVKDDTGFVYPQYYILITKMGDDWYVNTSALFKLIRFIRPGAHLKRSAVKLHQDILLKIRQVLQLDGLL